MIPYASLLFLIVSCGVISLSFSKLKLFLLGVSISAMTLLAGLRGSVGQDTWSYTYLYDSVFLGERLILVFSKFEPLFSTIHFAFKSVGLSAQSFLFFISLIQGGALYFVCKKMKAPFIFLIIYLFCFYLQFGFNVLRVGISCLFFALAILESRRGKSFFLYIVSCLFHFSAVPFFFVFLVLGKWPFRTTVVSFLILSFVFLGFFGEFILEKFDTYFDISGAAGLSIFGFIIFLGLPSIYFLASVFVGRLDVRMGLLVFVLLVLGVGRNYIDIVYRLYDFFSFILLVIFFRYFGFIDLMVRPRAVSVFMIFMVFSVVRVIGVINEPVLVSTAEGRGKIDYTFIPYTTFWKDDLYVNSE